MNTNFKLYYNIYTDALGITADGWTYIMLCTFVPVVRNHHFRNFPDSNEPPIDYVEHQTAQEFSTDWHFIGSL